jgi:hypothetical protein
MRTSSKNIVERINWMEAIKVGEDIYIPNRTRREFYRLTQKMYF